jgi:hypothetical protein
MEKLAKYQHPDKESRDPEMTTNFYTRLELRFWDWAIPTLTYSRRVHWVCKQLQPLSDRKFVRKMGLQSLIFSLAGFASGAAAFGIFNR